MNLPGLVEFRQLLPKLMSEINEVRSRAEQDYQDLDPQLKLKLLITTLKLQIDPPEILDLDSVLLRRAFRSNIHNQLKEAGVSLKPFKDELINLLKQPLSLTLKKKISDAAAEFDKRLIQSMSEEEEYQWPELMKYLFECIISQDIANKEIALNIIAYSPLILSKHLYEEEQCFPVLKQFFVACLNDNTQKIDFKIEAVKAITAFILAYSDDENLIKQLDEVVLHFMHLIVCTLSFEEDYCNTVLTSVQELAERCTYILKKHFDNVFRLFVETMLKIEVEEGRKRLCLEIVISLAEAIPSTVRKRGKQYLPQIINHLLHLMTDLDDDLEEWSNSDEVDNEDYDSNVVIGETSLDRLATALGGKTFLPIALEMIAAMCKNENAYNLKVAGLMAIATIGEGCHDEMKPLLGQIVNAVLPFLDEDKNNSFPASFKVQWAACNCIGQMSTDFSDYFQREFHNPVMTKLIALYSTSTNPRVQAHAAAAMVNFLEGCSSSIIKEYMDLMAEKISEIMAVKMKELAEKGKKLVLEQTIVTLSSLADSAQEYFVEYYDKFFPLLKYIIENAVTPELRLLRGKTIECISLIGLAVKEKFFKDAGDIMNLLLRTQTGEEKMDSDDPQLVYIIASWSRICKVLGPDFQPYLPHVMPEILGIASFKIEVTLLDKENVAEVEENEEVHCLGSGEDTFSIKTAGLEEKATACQMITCYARELKYAFVDYVEEVVKIMIPLLNFYFHERIRTAAAECLPYLIESGKAKGQAFVKNMWDFIFPELLKSIEIEPEKEVLCDMFASLSSCLDGVGKENVSESQINQIILILKKYLEEHFENVEERRHRRGDEDYDDDVEKELIEEDDEDCYILSKISDVIHSFFVLFKEAFLPHFELLLELFVKLAGSDRSYTEVQWSICVMDDCIEFTGPHSIKYKDFFLPLFINGLHSKHPEIRQASAYGFGVLGKCGGPAFAQNCAQSIPLLVQMIQAPDSRSDLNNLATENAISSVTKIIHFNCSHINVNEIIPAWFSWLPAWEDETELPYIYDFLFKLIETKHPSILGENNSNLPRILQIFAEVLSRNAIELNSELGQKILMFINSLKDNQTLLFQCLEAIKENPVHIQQLNQILNNV